jgi:uncharacterized protein YggE
MKQLALLAPLLAIAACHTTVEAPPAAAPVPQNGSFTVEGSASIDVTPDTADLHLTLSSQASRPGAATHAVRDNESHLVAALNKLGVETANLKLCQLRLDPVYDVKGEHVIAYSASIEVIATTHDFDQVGDMMEAAGNAGATSMSTDFHADMAAMKAKARTMALAAAKDKAKQIADGLGIATGKVIGVVENPMGPYGYANATFEDARAAGIGAAPDTLTLSVQVTYQLS